jgi:hypothetical protein
MQACACGNLEAAELLLTFKGVHSYAQQYAPFKLAAYNGHFHILAMLLERGVNMDDRLYLRPMDVKKIVRSGHYKVVELLVKYNVRL